MMVNDGSPAPELHEFEAVASATEELPRDERLRSAARVEGRSFQVLRKSFVKPATPTPADNRWLPFSNLDLTWLNFYSSVINIYRVNAANAATRETVGEHLRSSLEKALALFYPLAGRVVTPKEQASGIVCDDSGAVFVEACIDAELDDLQYENDYQPSFLLSGMAEAGLAEYPRLPQGPAGRPALILQVTHFKCGGITLAVNWAHPVADGFSGVHFMKSWAELARGEQVSLLPVHDRALVKPREPLILSDPCSEHYSSEFSSISTVTVSDHPKPNQTTPTVQAVEITKQLVDELKREVESEASQTRLSRACCVSAHVWRALVKARGIPGTDLTRMYTIVEGRKKLSLPAGYFGNAIQSIFTTTTVNTLLNKPLAYSASLVAATIQHASKDWFQDSVDWMEAKQFRPHPGQTFGQDHECGNTWLNRFPFYELDFGFGTPVCSTRNSCSAWDGYFAILPSSRSPDNFAAVFHTTPDVMKRFLPLLLHSSS